MGTPASNLSRTANLPAISPHNLYPGERAPMVRVHKTWAGYAIAIALFALVFSFWQFEPVPWSTHSVGILLFAVCLFPLAIWRASGSKSLPMFEVICLSYAIHFGLPLYLQPNEIIIRDKAYYLSWDSVRNASLLATLGVSSMIAGYYSLKAFNLTRRIPQVDLPLRHRRLISYIKFSGCVGFCLLLARALGYSPDNAGPLGAIMRVLINQFNVALILMAYQVYEGKVPRRGLLISLYALVIAAGLIGLSSGMLENALLPIAMVFIARWHVTRKVAWKFLIIGFLVFVLLSPVKSAYRDRVWFGEESVGLLDSITLWFDLAGTNIQEKMDSGQTGSSVGIIQETTSRFDLLHRFAYVGDLTPSKVPFYNGSTYTYFFLGWIPRIVWPNKPSATDSSHQLDVDYELLYDFQAYENGANIGIGLLPEAWVNFSWPGVLFIMLLQGMLLSTLNHALNSPRSEGGRAIYLSVMILSLNGIGTTFALLFTSLFQNVIANSILLRLFAKGFKASAKRSLPGN